MVVSCWVKGCSNRADNSVRRGFVSFPAVRENEGKFTKKLSEDRRRQWLANVNRKDTPSKYSKICSDHFVHGKPSSMYDRSNPDWAPTLLLGENLSPRKSMKKEKKIETDKKGNFTFVRAQERQKIKEKHHAARALLDLYEEVPIPEFTATPLVENIKTCSFVYSGQTEKLEQRPVPINPVTKSQVDSYIQRLLTENMLLKSQISGLMLNQDSFKGNDDKVKYYTGLPGLPDYLTLLTIFNFVREFLPKQRLSDLGAFERVVMTLMRLKFNLSVQDLAYRYQTSTSTVSRIFITVVHVMYVRLKHLIYWPQREELRRTMPLEFRQQFAQKTAVVIDCFEVFIQRPKNLLARAQTWSSYKHHNTVKFLIGITPQGSISFLSRAWGGRVSDKYITEHCGILEKLLPGDLVLADRGFDIADSVGMYCAQVNIPSFTKGRSQLSPTDIETTRKIAHVRIQVERVIG
ncbi:uncharacterized protein LOC123562971 [Mercenaria mercenaria]|uniref:uncharacterized protein LOC123562971 n=1 Tax=Mercenaria mercenaria TaxID=6596 RepID=UPI00234E612E|nr:uncharacterized protein LOC123562971 [Mercenaria mercenaria]